MVNVDMISERIDLEKTNRFMKIVMKSYLDIFEGDYNPSIIKDMDDDSRKMIENDEVEGFYMLYWDKKAAYTLNNVLIDVPKLIYLLNNSLEHLIEVSLLNKMLGKQDATEMMIKKLEKEYYEHRKTLRGKKK